MIKLNHPNIVKHHTWFKEEYIDKKNRKMVDYTLIMEYADGGNLLHYMDSELKKITSEKKLINEILFISKEICKGLKYLHSNNLIHRDIKPENIVLFKDGRIKICDCETVKELVGSTQTPQLGTLYYRAPESESGKYNESVDIWSFGMLLLHMGAPGTSIKTLYDLKEKTSFLDYEIINEILGSCLIEEKDRISINDLFKFIEISCWVNFEDYSKFEKLTFENDKKIKEYCSNVSVYLEIKEKFHLISTIETQTLKEMIYRFILNGERFGEERTQLLSNQNEMETIPHLMFLYFRNNYVIKGTLMKNFNHYFLIDYFGSSDSIEFLFSMSDVYLYGYGVESDLKKSIDFLIIAADQGDSIAQNKVSFFYYRGKGVEMNIGLALEYLKKSADQRNPDAQVNLGICYLEGIGVEKDEKKALEYFKKSADQGNSKGQLYLGACYQRGRGVIKNEKKGFEYFKKSANKGNPVAQYKVGICFQEGKGVKKDEKKAFVCFKKSADQGNSKAQLNLGVCYQSGEGVEKDLQKALESYEKSADQGNPDAQCFVGIYYASGFGVELDLKKAVEYFKKSAYQGDQLANHFLLTRGRFTE
jgi:TPR repeat protein